MNNIIKRSWKYLKVSILFYDILFMIIMLLTECILSLCGLIFMNWIFYSTIIIFLVGLFIGWIQLIIRIKHKELKIAVIVVSILGLLLNIFIFPYIYLVFAFGYTPEHIITVNDTKYVAEVNSFLEVKVNYYDYKNIFVRGKNKICTEDYGKGGYDFFTTNNEFPPMSKCFKDV